MSPAPSKDVTRALRAFKVALPALVLLTLVMAGATAWGITKLVRFLRRWDEVNLITLALKQDQEMRDHLCQRRAPDIGDVDLEDIVRTDVPGHDDQTRVTATAVADPPGMPVCRARVRFVYQKVVTNSEQRHYASELQLLDLTVGADAPPRVAPPRK